MHGITAGHIFITLTWGTPTDPCTGIQWPLYPERTLQKRSGRHPKNRKSKRGIDDPIDSSLWHQNRQKNGVSQGTTRGFSGLKRGGLKPLRAFWAMGVPFDSWLTNSQNRSASGGCCSGLIKSVEYGYCTDIFPTPPPRHIGMPFCPADLRPVSHHRLDYHARCFAERRTPSPQRNTPKKQPPPTHTHTRRKDIYRYGTCTLAWYGCMLMYRISVVLSGKQVDRKNE